jgi:hypothetical protein
LYRFITQSALLLPLIHTGQFSLYENQWLKF